MVWAGQSDPKTRKCGQGGKYHVGKVKTAEGQQSLLLAEVIKPIPITRKGKKKKEKKSKEKILCPSEKF